MPTQTTSTGADLDLGLAATPLHDFELTFELLRDTFAVGTSEFKTMLGFFGAMSGNLGRFLFKSLSVPQPVTRADADALRTLSMVCAQPSLVGGAYVMPSNGELLAFGAVATTGTYTANLTYLRRGQYGTVPSAHAIGDQFTVIDVLGSSGTTIGSAQEPLAHRCVEPISIARLHDRIAELPALWCCSRLDAAET